VSGTFGSPCISSWKHTCGYTLQESFFCGYCYSCLLAVMPARAPWRRISEPTLESVPSVAATAQSRSRRQGCHYWNLHVTCTKEPSTHIRISVRIGIRFAANRMAIRISVQYENIASTRNTILRTNRCTNPFTIWCTWTYRKAKMTFSGIGRQKLNRVQVGVFEPTGRGKWCFPEI
jgi:hypothetical protein